MIASICWQIRLELTKYKTILPHPSRTKSRQSNRTPGTPGATPCSVCHYESPAATVLVRLMPRALLCTLIADFACLTNLVTLVHYTVVRSQPIQASLAVLLGYWGTIDLNAVNKRRSCSALHVPSERCAKKHITEKSPFGPYGHANGASVYYLW